MDNKQVNIIGVVKPNVPKKTIFSPRNPEMNSNDKFPRTWQYPELDLLAKQYPYDIIDTIYIERLGPSKLGEFPAEHVGIQVPPSTHFGYTFEWIILAIITLSFGFALQAFPWLRVIFSKKRSSLFSDQSS